MKTRYFAELAFKGTYYHGWQIQPNAKTVQEILNYSFGTLLRESVQLTGAGRTDTGVHARYYVAHLDSSQPALDQDHAFLRRLNGFLPRDIMVAGIRKVKPDAHARFSAISRTYEYHILLQKDPFLDDICFTLKHSPDMEQLKRASAYFEGEKDFSAFAKKGSETGNSLCQVFESAWQRENNLLIFRIRANRFLRNMVRAIVGTCLDVERKHIPAEDIPGIFLSANRSEAGESVPAKGLHLTSVVYPTDIYL